MEQESDKQELNKHDDTNCVRHQKYTRCIGYCEICKKCKKYVDYHGERGCDFHCTECNTCHEDDYMYYCPSCNKCRPTKQYHEQYDGLTYCSTCKKCTTDYHETFLDLYYCLICKKIKQTNDSDDSDNN